MLMNYILPLAAPHALRRVMSPQVITDAHEAALALKGEIAAAHRAVVLTGAGVSTDSGIPDFRSPGGIWSRMAPIEYGEFCADEDARLEDWRRRFEMAKMFGAAEPNAAHRSIARLCREGPVDLVVTQNIDGLHSRAGTPPDKLIEIHGTAAHAHCLSCRTRHEIDEARRQIDATGVAPRCRMCGGFVKAAIVSFGEPMPEDEMLRAQEAVEDCDLLIAAGSSLVVYPVATLPLLAHEVGARLVIASRAPTAQDELADLVVRSPLSATFENLERIELA